MNGINVLVLCVCDVIWEYNIIAREREREEA